MSRHAFLFDPPPETLTPIPWGRTSVFGSRPFAKIDGRRKEASTPVKPLVTTMSLALLSMIICLNSGCVLASADARNGEPT